MDKPKSAEFTLEPTSELRIETVSKCSILLKSGYAEIFGTELSRNKEYTFNNGGKFAVFTWHGCTLLMTGNTDHAYKSQETPMVFYVNIHTALEQMRCKAEKNNECRGPRVMIVGPDDVGKTTLCRMLLNWAVRVGRSPIFVDLDVSQNSISLPGTISSLVVERTASVEEGFNLDAQLAFHFGYKTPNENPVLYKTLISTLIDRINFRCEKIHATLVSGLIINTSGWIRDEGYKSLVHVATEFDVDMILVIDQERLRVDLIKDLQDRLKDKILSIPKSGGVVSKSPEIRTQFKYSRIREYFYGFKSNLFPHNIEIKFNEAKIYRIGAPQMSDDLLPMGINREENYTKIFRITPSMGLIHHLLSVIHAYDDNKDENKSDFLEANIAGYLVVTEVNMEKSSMKVLCPKSKLPPKSVLLVSDVQFVDLT